MVGSDGHEDPRQSPLLLWLDDLDADDAAIAEVAAQLRGPAPPPWSLLLAGVCPERLSPRGRRVVHGLITDGLAEAVLLGPLDVRSSVRLVERRAGSAVVFAPGLLEDVVRRGQGNPGRLVDLAARLTPRPQRPRYQRISLEEAMVAARTSEPAPPPPQISPTSPHRDVPRTARVAVLQGWAELENAGPSAALARCERALRLARGVGDRAAAAHAQALAAVALADLGMPGASRQRLQRAAAATPTGKLVRAPVLTASAQAVLLCGDPASAIQRAEASLHALRDDPPGPDHVRAGVTLAWCRWRAGRLGEAAALIDALRPIDGLNPLAARYRVALDCLLAAELGEPERAREMAVALLARDARRGPPRAMAWSAWAAGRALVAARAPDLGARWLVWAAQAHARQGAAAGELAALADLIEVAAAGRRLNLAGGALPRLDELARALPAALHIELAARATALVRLAAGEVALAASAAERALAQPSASPTERARTLRAAASAVSAQGQGRIARSLLERGAELAAAAGAVTERRRCEQALERWRRPVQDALSERERQVSALVAEGLTNREVAEHLGISARTVDHHVARVLQKLRLPNRTRLARWAAGDVVGLDLLPVMAVSTSPAGDRR